MILTSEERKLLTSLGKQPYGQAFIQLLRRSLDEVNTALRTATAEKIGWLQGEAQCLAQWIKEFEQADKIGR